jgi:VWFA-related protein
MSRSRIFPLASNAWWGFLFLIALIVLVPSVRSAHSQAVSEKTSAPTIVSNVDEVSLDVVVRDKKKKPVVDLKPDELAITDNGTPVKIADLRLITPASGSDRLLTLIFDRMDTSVAGNARELAGKVLKEVPASGFSLSVLSIEGRLKLYQNFTSDRTLITQAIRAATEAPRNQKSAEAEAAEKKLFSLARTGTDESGVRVKSEQRSVAQVLVAALQDSQQIIQEQHTNASLAGLLALARAQRKLPGRKVVIYFSQGTNLGTDSDEMLGTIVGAANRSGVSIYTIDANVFNEQTAQGLLATMALGNSISMGQSRVSAPQALTGPPPTPVGDLTTPGMKSMISSQLDRFQTRDSKGDKGPLADLAAGTDGGHVPAGENPRKIVRNMLQDLSTYYEVSYIPPIKEYDGQFRPVVVKPLRKGMKTHSRAGYFAVPPHNDTGFKLFEAPLLKVFTEAQLPSDIKFQARILQLGDIGSGDANSLLVEVPVSDLVTKDDPNTNLYSFHASIVAQIKNKSGEVIEHFSEDSPKHGALDSKEAARESTLAMQRHFMADPGEYTLEAAVLDRNSGKIGAMRTSFVIAQSSSGSSLSDIVLVQRLDPFPDEIDPAEPLRFGDRKIIPTVMDRMNRGAKQIQLFSIVHPNPQSNQPPRLELTVLRNKEPIAQVPLQLRTRTGAAVPYVASIQSGSLPAGDYQLIETLTQGEKTSEKSLTFRIDGPELASATTPANASSTAPNADELGMLATSKLQTNGPHQLVITSLPEGSVPAPSADELQTMVEAARKHAVGYAKSLPNFVCVETTNRSVDTSGNGAWKRRDTIAELLRFVDNVETRTIVERNGMRSSLQRSDLDPTWASSVGEFGHLLNLVFQSESKADFQWKEAATLGSTTVQVLSYRVSSKNATMVLSDSNSRIGVGFHGLAYVDSATGGVRRITMEADDVPRDFSIHAASMTVDYDYVTIGAHDYLMPMRAVVALRRGHKQTDLNEMAFRGYRRYSSQAKIIVNP